MPRTIRPATLRWLHRLQATYDQAKAVHERAEQALNIALATVAHEHGVDPDRLVIDMDSGDVHQSRRKDSPHAEP